MWTFYHESNQQGGFDFMCVPPELRCDFKTHASALCATGGMFHTDYLACPESADQPVRHRRFRR
jgi:hypothetical protein